jgi:hypothetical protein
LITTTLSSVTVTNSCQCDQIGLIAEQILLDHPEAAIRYRATHPPRSTPSAPLSISRPPPGFEARSGTGHIPPQPTAAATTSSSSSSTAPVPVTRSGSAATSSSSSAVPSSNSSNTSNNNNNGVDGAPSNDGDHDDDGYDDDDEHTSEFDDQVHGAVARRKSARSRGPAKRASTRGRTSATGGSGSRKK